MNFTGKSVYFSGADTEKLNQIGRLVAEKLKYKFFDVNLLIENELSMPVSEMVSKMDKSYFRVVEHSFIDKLSRDEKVVAVCGPGAMLTEKNFYTAKRNGVVVYIEDKTGSQNPARLLQKPLYEKHCDIKLEYLKTAEETANALLKLL